MTTDGPVEEDDGMCKDDSAGGGNPVDVSEALRVTVEGESSSLLATDGPPTENSTVGKLVILND